MSDSNESKVKYIFWDDRYSNENFGERDRERERTFFAIMKADQLSSLALKDKQGELVVTSNENH